jgi:serine/threonine-protein kinase
VAIKVLSEPVAGDRDRLLRFQREAEVLASLNHPNIAAIYGLERSGGITALVMELVEGPTLADRIAQGPIPIEEVLPIAKQIAEALEAAHEQGVIHRDLKPANVKVRPDGTVKVLDFGLAKALDPVASAGVDATASPTITSPALMTGVGVLLGTAAYMSPEQARGKPVDRRADIWAFGCVLYEMLTGTRAFAGEDITETLAAVVKMEPDWNRLPEGTADSTRTLLRRCLRKDPRQRLQDAASIRIEIDETLTVPAIVPSAVAATKSTRRLHFVWSLVLIAAIAITGLATWVSTPALPTLPVTRVVISLPPEEQLGGLGSLDLPVLALSPDGTKLAYVATRNNVRQIYVRPLDVFESRPIPGTEGALSPFFSADGQWIGFLAGGSLKKVLMNGGAAQTVFNTGVLRGASWGSSGIVFTGTTASPLYLASATGAGSPRPLTRLEKGESSHRFAQFLPDGQTVLFAAGAGTVNMRIAAFSMTTGQRQTLVTAGTSPHFIPPEFLIYAQSSTLMASRFDTNRLEVVGTPVPVLEGVLQSLANGFAHYDVSAGGLLVYLSGGVQGTNRKMTWVDRNGSEQGISAPARGYRYPRISPDGSRVAVTIEEGESHVWVYDTRRDALTRLTSEGGVNLLGAWTPDGKRIAFSSTRAGPQNPFWQSADGSGTAERLLTSENVTSPMSFSPDGQTMLYVDVSPDSGYDIAVLRLSDGKAEPYLRTRFFEGGATFSPDGRWLAYTSDEAGRQEIFVQPYPGPGGKLQVSTEGGTEPVWNRNGRELFYRSGNKMMAVDVTTGSPFSAGKPRILFETEYVPTPASLRNYDVSADGQRFLMLKAGDQTQTVTQINVVTNWSEELKRLVPAN